MNTINLIPRLIKSALVYALTFNFTSSASAEIIKCNGIYTNQSCESVEGKRFSYSVVTLKNTDGTVKKRIQEPRASLTTRPFNISPLDSECTPLADGIDVRITDTAIRRNIQGDNTKSTIIGTIRNFSDKDLNAPVQIEVKDSSGKVVSKHTIVNQLNSFTSVSFSSELLYTSKPLPHDGMYSLKVNYSPALQCDSTTIDLNNASSTKGVASYVPAKASNDSMKAQEIADSIKKLEKSIQEAHNKRTLGGYKDSTEKERELMFLRMSVVRVCARMNEIDDFTIEPKARCRNAFDLLSRS